MKQKKELNLLLGANIQREREKMGWTQAQFSEMIGMGEKNLSAIECGARGVSLEMLVKICRTLHVSSDTLLMESAPLGDVSELSARLERLSGEQFRIVREVVIRVLEAFHVGDAPEK